MADDKEIVYVPQGAQQNWLQQPAFWMGVASSLVAAAIFWYVVHDIWPVEAPDGHNEKDEAI